MLPGMNLDFWFFFYVPGIRDMHHNNGLYSVKTQTQSFVDSKGVTLPTDL